MGVHTNASMKDTVQNGPLGSFCVKVPPHLGIILHERSLMLDFLFVFAIILTYLGLPTTPAGNGGRAIFRITAMKS